jgi:hypothetical protein
MLAATAIAVFAAATAHASYYKMLLCAGNNGSNGYATATNTASGANPGGIFSFENHCGPAPDPAGSNAFLRIAENQSAGNAGETAYGSISWSAPAWVSIAAGGGYTREPNVFNEGWRGRFWAEGYDGSTNNILMQGTGVANGSLGGIGWAPTSTFASHLWPFGGYGNYRRFVFELTCVRSAGCDRTNFNAVDANTMTLILNDADPSHVNFTNTGSGILSGQWVRGTQNVTWDTSDNGSGLRFERLRVDGAQRYLIDHRGSCNLDATEASGEFARDFQPCPTGGPYGRAYSLDTTGLADGAHTVQACSQDYGQAVGLNGSGGESCDQRTVNVDNTPPSAPGGLSLATANPARYLDRFGASWTIPPDPGSPIAKVHYNVVNAAGTVVVPEQTVSATNPTKLEAIEGPKAPGEYRLRVWLEDAVGFTGPVATVPIPHDTTPPAAPQDLSVTAPNTPRSADGFDLRWRNVADAGSPIDAAHYQVLDGAGKVVVATQAADGEGVQSIADLETPSAAGAYALRLWLTDEEGNVGAPVTAPLAYDCMRSPVSGGEQLSAGFAGQPTQTVQQGSGALLSGALRGASGPVATAPVCIYSQVETDQGRDFLGIALTDQGGAYRFPVGAGPSRELSAIYRPGQRQLSASASLQTVVQPTLRARNSVVRNGEYAHLEGDLPGPHNDEVVVVLQVRQGNGWLAFRRYRTRGGGHYEADYLFRRATTKPTSYEMRAQVRETVGYPYLQGESAPLALRVVPGPAPRRRAHHRRCGAHRHPVKRGGKVRCARAARHPGGRLSGRPGAAPSR